MMILIGEARFEHAQESDAAFICHRRFAATAYTWRGLWRRSSSHKGPSMSARIHPQARIIPKIRQEIKDSGLSHREAAKVFNITRATAAKWLKRDDVQDRSHRTHTLHTTLSATHCASRSICRSTTLLNYVKPYNNHIHRAYL
ncbi:MAG: hypothetical protein RSE46_01850 [Janthinobacterium sp.]